MVHSLLSAIFGILRSCIECTDGIYVIHVHINVVHSRLCLHNTRSFEYYIYYDFRNVRRNYVRVRTPRLLIYQLKHFGMSLRGFHIKQGLYKLRSKNDFFICKYIRLTKKLFYLLMSKFNSTRNAFDFGYSKSEKGGFLSFTYFEIGTFLTLGVKGTLHIFRACLFNVDNFKRRRSIFFVFFFFSLLF